MGIPIGAVRGHTHHFHEFFKAGFAHPSVFDAKNPQPLFHRLADGHSGVQRSEGVLENNLHLFPVGLHLFFG